MSTAYFVTYVTICCTMNNVHKKQLFSLFFLFANFCVCFNTELHKNIQNVYFMEILMKLATCHICNAFKRPLHPNAQKVYEQQ